MEKMKVVTPDEYMLECEWDHETLIQAKKHLEYWDTQEESYYANHNKVVKNGDLIAREHYRNCVNFWEKRLIDEIKSS